MSHELARSRTIRKTKITPNSTSLNFINNILQLRKDYLTKIYQINYFNTIILKFHPRKFPKWRIVLQIKWPELLLYPLEISHQNAQLQQAAKFQTTPHCKPGTSIRAEISKDFLIKIYKNDNI